METERDVVTNSEKLARIKMLMDLRQAGRVSGLAVAIGLVILENAGRDGRCSLSREDIGARAGVRRIPTISAKITELRKAGFMDVEWSCRINSYHLNRPSRECSSASKRNGK